MVDTPVLGAGAARREGSSPFIRTNQKVQHELGFLIGTVTDLKLKQDTQQNM